MRRRWVLLSTKAQDRAVLLQAPSSQVGSLEMPQEEVAGDRQLEIYYQGSVITGSLKFTGQRPV